MAFQGVGNDNASTLCRHARGEDQGEDDFILPIIVDIFELVIRDIAADLFSPPVFNHTHSVPFHIIDLCRGEELYTLERACSSGDVFDNDDFSLAVLVCIISDNPKINAYNFIRFPGSW